MADEIKPCRCLTVVALALLLPLAVFAEDGPWETVCEENGVLRDAGEIPPLLGKLMEIDPQKGGEKKEARERFGKNVETAVSSLRIAGRAEAYPLDERERKTTQILREEGVAEVFLEGKRSILSEGEGRILAETFFLEGYYRRGGKKIPWRVSFAKGRRWPFFF